MVDEKKAIIIVESNRPVINNINSVPTKINDKKALITLQAIVVKINVLVS